MFTITDEFTVKAVALILWLPPTTAFLTLSTYVDINSYEHEGNV